MPNLTVRNIPDWALKLLRERAAADRRSLNNEILVLLEQAAEQKAVASAEEDLTISRAAQIRRWEDLCGRWQDDRGWEEITADIVSHRTTGREVKF